MAAKLHFRYGSMNTGKSTALLQIAHNYEEIGQAVAIFTAKIDDRTEVGMVSSRLGVSRPAFVFDDSFDFLNINCEYVDCILVDEAQFLNQAQVVQLHKLAARRGKAVICFGLRTDFQGEPFAGSAMLLALADELQEIRAMCRCGRKSTMNARLDDNGLKVDAGPQIMIGGNQRYRQMCATCFYG